MSGDGLGDRMKRYERPWAGVLPPNSWVVVRVDGRAFHTWTRHCDRPFDERVHASMVAASAALACDISGFRLAYTQSDEASFLFTDTATHDSQLWFGGEVSKIVSIAAAAFTAHFNAAYATGVGEMRPAMFDARVFTIPADDAANAFVWRQRDWERNSLQMLARYHFSHRDLTGKGRNDMHEMLHSIGVNWANLPDHWKNGTTLYTQGGMGPFRSEAKHTWESFNRLARIGGP